MENNLNQPEVLPKPITKPAPAPIQEPDEIPEEWNVPAPKIDPTPKGKK